MKKSLRQSAAGIFICLKNEKNAHNDWDDFSGRDVVELMAAGDCSWGYLLIWPTIGFRYLLIERIVLQERCTEVSCRLDTIIPFCEWFLLPYVLWYFLIIGIHLYTFFYDKASYEWYSKYLITVFSLSTVIFLLFPTCQNLRPEAFPRENYLTSMVSRLYQMDTNTNVCPSEHVIGSAAAFLAVLRTKRLCRPGWILFFCFATVSASLATVFLKQHSAVDVIAAVPVCILGSIICRNRK